MKTQRKLIKDAMIVSSMIALSYLGGWWAFGVGFANSRQIEFDFSKPYIIPQGYEPMGTQPTLDTASFAAGDRIDIFVERSSIIEPLMLDVIVTRKTKTNFRMLLPDGGRELLAHARDSGLRLIYRRSIIPADPIAIKPYRG